MSEQYRWRDLGREAFYNRKHENDYPLTEGWPSKYHRRWFREGWHEAAKEGSRRPEQERLCGIDPLVEMDELWAEMGEMKSRIERLEALL